MRGTASRAASLLISSVTAHRTAGSTSGGTAGLTRSFRAKFWRRAGDARGPHRPSTQREEAPVLGIDSLRLKHRENGLSFEFAALNPPNPSTCAIASELEGLEEKWIEVDSEHRQARYTELAPGDYTFRAEASSDRPRPGSGRSAALRFTIAAPLVANLVGRNPWCAAVVGLLARGATQLRLPP